MKFPYKNDKIQTKISSVATYPIDMRKTLNWLMKLFYRIPCHRWIRPLLNRQIVYPWLLYLKTALNCYYYY